MARRKELIEAVSETLASEAEALVRARGEVNRTGLPGWKDLGPSAREELLAALRRRGLSVPARGKILVSPKPRARAKSRAPAVPAAEQIRSLVCHGSRLAWSAVAKRIVGVPKKERDAALAEALLRAEAFIVVRTTVHTMVAGQEDVLTHEEIDRCADIQRQLGALLKRVQAPLAKKEPLSKVKKTLLREDLAAILHDLSTLVRASPRRLSDGAARDALLRRIEQLEKPPIPLVWIPDLTKSLSDVMAPEQVKTTLFDARARGLLELRPESGMGRLSAEDANLCPRDSDGVPLSHTLRLSPR